MNIKNVQRCAIALAMTVSFQAQAANILIADLFPSSPVGNMIIPTPIGTGTTPGNGDTTTPGGTSTVRPLPGTPGGTTPIKPGVTPSTGGKVTMSVAQVGKDYQCPVFDSVTANADLFKAIDALNKEVQASPECTGVPSAKSLQDSGATIKDSIEKIQAVLAAQDASGVNPAQIDQTMTAALGAVANIGNIVNNNAFLNSSCGRQTMSTGRVLLALNDVINGLGPYALLAVSMNAALAPALPFVAGGIVASAGISAVAKMIDQNTLDMSLPEHRKAVLQNTCQFTKVAMKYRFIQLAQTGRIENITKELEKNLDLYNAKFSSPSSELKSLLAYREAKTKANLVIENQYAADRSDLVAVETQMAQNNDDLMVCTLATELASWAKDGKTFPTSAFNNLEAATSQSERGQRLQAASLKALNLTSLRRISETSDKAYEDETALKTCAQAGRSWVAGIRQAVTLTYTLTQKSRADLEGELMTNTEYSQWNAQYTRLQNNKVTVSRAQKAMEELAKDDSIISRSEMYQRMNVLKKGLFGSRSSWGFGAPPVLAWINHTKKMHDQTVASLAYDMKTLRNGAFGLTDYGRGKALQVSIYGELSVDGNIEYQSVQQSQSLATFNKTQLPVGTREHEVACQQLEAAWVDWSASIDHLGAIQFFCNMIDGVLDPNIDASVIKACRGDLQLNGDNRVLSMVDGAKSTLVKKGYRDDATLVKDKMDELECPMPPVSALEQ